MGSCSGDPRLHTDGMRVWHRQLATPSFEYLESISLSGVLIVHIHVIYFRNSIARATAYCPPIS